MRSRAVALVLTLAFAVVVLGQTGTGNIQGTVKDPAAAVVPNAKVDVIHTQTTRQYSTTTNEVGFYLFPSVAAFLSPKGLRTSIDFADTLLAEEHVVTTAGEAFDAPGYLRVSYANSLENLREGVTRLIRFARKHG